MMESIVTKFLEVNDNQSTPTIQESFETAAWLVEVFLYKQALDYYLKQPRICTEKSIRDKAQVLVDMQIDPKAEKVAYYNWQKAIEKLFS